MHDLPGGWKRTLLREVTEMFNGKATGIGGTWLRVFKTRHVYDGYLHLSNPVFVPDPSADRVPKNTYLRTGDTLTPNMAHGTIGRVAFVREAEENWTVDGQVTVLRPKSPEELEGRYLFDWMSRKETKQLLISMEKGGAFDEKRGQTHIYRSDIGTISIAIPPLSEQRKIAAILSSVDETIEKTQAVIDQLEVVKEGLRRELLTQGMPGRHKEFKETKLGSIPAEWELRPATELCERIVVGIVVQPAKYYVESGVPCLRSKNIREDRIELSNLVFLSPASNRLHAKSIIRAGDVLTVRTGYPGTSAVASPELDGANCVDIIISTPKPGLRGGFMARFINSPAGMQQIAIGQGGLAQQHFNVGAMKSLLVPVPSLTEQDEILERLAAVDDSLSHNRTVHSQLRTMKAGLLDLLLSGKLRVPIASQEAA
jgi:type I restriction enzyme S subunit